ncbi:helix-turn-helix domain-containing protein [Streptomyces sp. NPDC020800]|uniref:helix-turn-helix domain-containing protein n=1 Tax=Streptomyces sp. NPDC020800 TaxID=3365092 RepID=UPI0037B00013
MVGLSWSGQQVPAIADELRCSAKTVRRCLHRFNQLGLERVEDLGGQGRRRRITEAERSHHRSGQAAASRSVDRAGGWRGGRGR